MPSVVFWPGVGGGTEHYRCRTPGAGLERAGWEVRYVEDDNCDLAADVVVLQRVVHPATADAVRTLQRHGTFVVYDIDDWYDGIPAYNPAGDKIGPAELGWVHDALGAADLITCSTPELAEGYARLGPTLVLPNYLDPDLWCDAEKYRTPRTHVHVGWMGAFHWRGGDLELLKGWLPEFVDARPDVRFVACGCGELLDYLGVGGLVSPKLYPTADNWIRPYEHLPAMLAWLDVGLVPLAHNKFNQAKSWCKGMEYAACGVPCVASPSREYRTFVQPGVNGLLVRRNEWARAVDSVLGDLDGYRRRAREHAQRYWIDDHIHRWVDAYTSALVPA